MVPGRDRGRTRRPGAAALPDPRRQWPSGELPPNNWRSLFGGEGWSRLQRPDGTPEQWYLHLFDTHQPDLDWNTEAVREGFDDILRHWLDLGVDGFRVDVAHSLIKANGLPDEDATIDRSYFNLGPMWDQDGVHDIYRRWRKVLEEYDGDRVLVAEAWVPDPERLARYVRSDEMHQAFNFDFLTSAWDAASYRKVITETMAANAAVGAPTTWVLSNHDVVRHATRLAREDPSDTGGIAATDPQPDAALGLRRARAATLMMLALPGSAYLYQGEELGLPEHTAVPDHLRQDPIWFRSGHQEVGRDGCRIPMPWVADAPGAGFSPNGQTWLPQPDSYAALAADQQVGGAGVDLDDVPRRPAAAPRIQTGRRRAGLGECGQGRRRLRQRTGAGAGQRGRSPGPASGWRSAAGEH